MSPNEVAKAIYIRESVPPYWSSIAKPILDGIKDSTSLETIQLMVNLALHNFPAKSVDDVIRQVIYGSFAPCVNDQLATYFKDAVEFRDILMEEWRKSGKILDSNVLYYTLRGYLRHQHGIE